MTSVGASNASDSLGPLGPLHYHSGLPGILDELYSELGRILCLLLGRRGDEQDSRSSSAVIDTHNQVVRLCSTIDHSRRRPRAALG